LTIRRYGSITGKLPIQPNNKQTIIKDQNQTACHGLNKADFTNADLFKTDIINKQIINKAIKKIPNNLLVTERKTAYKGKKYHSGTIWGGVTKKFAFS
jgi:hypothetical protein